MPENMSKEEQRRAHRDERQRQNKFRMRIFYIAIIVFVLIVGLVLSFTVFFHVSKVEIRGYSIYSESEIEAVSGVKKGDNLFLINQSKVKEHITEKLPYIGDVEVKISLPNKLIVTVFETSIKCAALTSEGYVLLNEDAKVLGTVANLDEVYAGAILEGGKEFKIEEPVEEEIPTEEVTTPAEETDVPAEEAETPAEPETTQNDSAKYVLADKEFVVLKGVTIKSAKDGKIATFDTDKGVSIYSEIIHLFMENNIKGITELDLSDLYNIVMKYEDRIDVKVGSVTNLENKMAFAAQVIKDQDAATPDQAGTIDLTIDKKAYFQPATSSTTQATTMTTLPEGETTASTTEATQPETQTNSSGVTIQVARTTTKNS